MDPFKPPRKSPAKRGNVPMGAGHIPAPQAYKHGPKPGVRQPEGYVETLKDKQEFELIRLRTLVLKLEKEKEDAITVCQDLKRDNTELQQELSKSNVELQRLKREHNELRCRQWLDNAQGLSHVRAAALEAAAAAVAATAAATAVPLTPGGPSGTVAASTHGRSVAAVGDPAGLNATNGTTDILLSAADDPGPPSPRSDTPPAAGDGLTGPLASQPPSQQQQRPGNQLLTAIEEARDEGIPGPSGDAAQGPNTPRSKALGSITSSPIVKQPSANAINVNPDGNPSLTRTSNSTSSVAAMPQNASARVLPLPPPAAALPTGITPPMSPAVGARLTGVGHALGSNIAVSIVAGAPGVPAVALSGPPGSIPGSLPSQQVQQQKAVAAAQAALLDENRMLSLQLADFKDRVMYLQQEMTEERSKHDASIAARKELEERLAEITAAAAIAVHGGPAGRQGGWRNSSGGLPGGGAAGARDLLRAQSHQAPSPLRGGPPAGASNGGGEERGGGGGGAGSGAEHSLNALQELITRLREDRETVLAGKQKDFDAMKQRLDAANKEVEMLKQQVSEANRVIVEKLSRAPSAEDMAEMRAHIDKLKRQLHSKSKHAEEANARVAALMRELAMRDAAATAAAAAVAAAAAHADAMPTNNSGGSLGTAASDRQSAVSERQSVVSERQSASRGTAQPSPTSSQPPPPLSSREASQTGTADFSTMPSTAVSHPSVVAVDSQRLQTPQISATEPLPSEEVPSDISRAAAEAAAAAAIAIAAVEAEGRIAELQSRIRELEAAATAHEAAVQASERERIAREAHATEQAAALAELQARCTTLADRGEQAASRAAEEEARVSELRVRLAEMQSEAAAQRTAAESRASELEAELASQRAGAEARASELQRQLELERREVADASAALADAQASLASTSLELQRKARDLEEVRGELAEVRHALAAAREEAVAAAARFADQLAESRAETEAAAAVAAGARYEVAEAEATAARLDGELVVAQGEAADLRGRLEACTNRERELQARLAAMQASAEAQVAALAQHDTAIAELHAVMHATTERLNALTTERDDVAEQLAVAREAAALRERELGTVRREAETLRGELEARSSELVDKTSQLTSSLEQLAAVEPTLASLRASLDAARTRTSELEAQAGAATTRSEALATDLREATSRVSNLAGRLSAAESRGSQLSRALVSREQEVTSLQSTVETQEGRVQDLSSRNARMQALIKEMAGQMEVLQGSLAKQTGLVAKLEAALVAAGMQTAEIEELHRSQSLAYRERIEDTQRKLSSTRLKLTELSKEVNRMTANGGVSQGALLASSRGELAVLFKKIKHVAQVYRLSLPTILAKQLRTDGANLTELQLFQLLHAVLAALEASGGGAAALSSVSSLSSVPPSAPSPSSTSTSPLPPPPLVAAAAQAAATSHPVLAAPAAGASRPGSNGTVAAPSPLPPHYNVRAALMGAGQGSPRSDAGGGGGASGGADCPPLMRTLTIGSGGPRSPNKCASVPLLTGGVVSVGPCVAAYLPGASSSGGAGGPGSPTIRAEPSSPVRSALQHLTASHRIGGRGGDSCGGSSAPHTSGGGGGGDTGTKGLYETGSVVSCHSRRHSLAESVIDEVVKTAGHDLYDSIELLELVQVGESSSGGGGTVAAMMGVPPTLPMPPAAPGASGSFRSRESSRPSSICSNRGVGGTLGLVTRPSSSGGGGRRHSDSGATSALSGIPSVPTHLPPLVSRPSASILLTVDMK